MNRPAVVCLTPCCNEAWVIEKMLAAASQWADYIVLGDQASTDGTREIAAKFEKVLLAENCSQGYDEGERHRVVLERARQIPGKKIFLAIDADEILTANWKGNSEWSEFLNLPVGTAIYGEWLNIKPEFRCCFRFGGPFIIGYVDDERLTHSPGKYHVPRILPPSGSPRFDFKSIKLLHYQYADQRRFESKNRAYQVEEWCSNPSRAIRLFRRFNPMHRREYLEDQAIDPGYVLGLEQTGIHWKEIGYDQCYRWDDIVLHRILEYGTKFFRKLDIWSVDWGGIARARGIDSRSQELSDPRSPFDKWVHAFLRRTQRSMDSRAVRLTQVALRVLGW